jgi:uncharacterized membrane protein YqiK
MSQPELMRIAVGLLIIMNVLLVIFAMYYRDKANELQVKYDGLFKRPTKDDEAGGKPLPAPLG